jgi:hypothetical protein
MSGIDPTLLYRQEADELLQRLEDDLLSPTGVTHLRNEVASLR